MRSPQSTPAFAFALVAASLAATALVSPALAADDGPPRAVQDKDLAVEVERYVLPNGLTVLLSPDPTAPEVLVDASFRAGTLYEPPGRSGLAHFVEHVMMAGTSSATEYGRLLAARGARGVNAFTSPHLMTFRAVVPPEELPLALWVHADRLGTLPGTWVESDLERHRKVVEVERLQRTVDVHFGAVDRLIQARTYPAPHPLHAGVAGDPKELAKVSLQDVRGFVKRWLTPSNGVLILVGAFDPAQARQWIDRTLGAVPISAAAPQPRLRLAKPVGEALAVTEHRSRRPRVSFVWRLPAMSEEVADALRLGSMLVRSYIDGAFGTRVEAWVEHYPDGGVFRLQLTLPHDKPMKAARDEAEALLRYLTAVDMPRDVFAATRVMIDRQLLFALDSLSGRAYALGWAELVDGDVKRLTRRLTRHWRFARHDIQHIAWKTLTMGPPRIEVHGRPSRPLKPKLDWDDRFGERE